MQKNIRTMVYIGLLSALAFTFYALEIPVGAILPTTPFLKIDFSDVPAYIATLGMGPVAGSLVELIKNVLHIAITKEPALSGEIGNFLSGMCMILPAYFVLRIKTKHGMLLKRVVAVFASAIACAACMMLFNYFVTLPLYGISDTTEKWSMLLTGFLPFNLIKCILISIISIILFDILKKSKIFH